MPFFGNKEQRELDSQARNNIMIVNTDFINDENLHILGLVSGSRFVMSVIGESDVERAIDEMRQAAVDCGADAIINFRYAPSTNHAYVWGTAVKFV